MPVTDEELQQMLTGNAGLSALNVARELIESRRRLAEAVTERERVTQQAKAHSELVESITTERESIREKSKAERQALKEHLAKLAEIMGED